MTESHSAISKQKRYQYQGTCYAHAFATVIRAAQLKGRFTKTPHDEIVKQATKKYGSQGANIEQVLEDLCPIYGMSWKKINDAECETAIGEGQGIIAGFFLTNLQWIKFSSFYEENPQQVMKEADFIVNDQSTEKFGHAVVISGKTDDYWRLKNSWGEDFADKGEFRISKLGLPFVYYKVYYLAGYRINEYTAGNTNFDSINSKRSAYYDDIKEYDKIIKKLRGALVATNSAVSIPDEDKPTEIKRIKPLFENDSHNVDHALSTGELLRIMHGNAPMPNFIFAKNKINKVGIQQFTVKVEGLTSFGVGIAADIYHREYLDGHKHPLQMDRKKGASRNCYVITNEPVIFGDGIFCKAINIENPTRQPKKINSGDPITVTIDFEKGQISFKVQGITDTKVKMNSQTIFNGDILYPVVMVYGTCAYKAEFLD